VKDYLNINEAAKVTGLSIPTIRAKLSRGLLPNAHQVQDGKRQLWRIPFNDLIAAGLIDKALPGPEELADNRARDLELLNDKLTAELEATKELLKLTAQTLEDYRERERRLYYTLETSETQQRRRSLWERLRGN
jgi:hypothetical protein